MNKHGPGIGGLAAIAGFTLSVGLLLTFLWIAFGGSLPTAPEGYRFKAAFPEAALLVNEADVRMAGVNVGKVKGKELAPGGRRTIAEIEIDHRFAPVKRDARVMLRQKSLLGETYVEIAPGSRDAPDLPEGALLPRANVERTVELDEIFSAFDAAHAAELPGLAARVGHRHLGQLRRGLQRRARERRAVLHRGRACAPPARRAGRGPPPPRAQHGTRGDGRVRGRAQPARPDHGRRGHLLGARLARRGARRRRSRCCPRSCARRAPPSSGWRRSPATPTRSWWTCTEPADDLTPTLRDLAALSPDLEHLFRSIGPLTTASETGVPAADRLLEGVQPALESAHVFLPELNPILAYLAFSQEQIATFLAPGGSALGGNGQGGYRSASFAEHYLPQSAIIDSRSLQRRTSRPPWERANSYLAPNSWERSIGLGAIEAFDCKPSGGEVKNPSGTGATSAPPCFVAPRQLFQDQHYPRLRRGHAPHVKPPKGRAGNSPAVP